VAKRADVLVVRRRLGFGADARREHFVVLQSDLFHGELDTVIVVPLDEDAPMYDGDPLVVRVTPKEAGTKTTHVVLVAHLTSVLLDRFDSGTVGRLRPASMLQVERIAAILLSLR
jgi:mRNA-degrading endonuclease toxin of MazEF toxin-antitoxin module